MSRSGPREKIWEGESHHLSDEEVLCVLLGVRPERGLARELLADFGTLREILAASPAQWKTYRGLGPTRMAQLLALKETTIRASQTHSPRTSILSPELAAPLFESLRWADQELVMAAFLSSRKHLLRRQVIFKGSLDSSIACPREILRAALGANAASFILAHNHPSGSTEPSEEDVLITARLEWAGRTVGIPLIDHLIFSGSEKVFSFSEAGMLEVRA